MILDKVYNKEEAKDSRRLFCYGSHVTIASFIKLEFTFQNDIRHEVCREREKAAPREKNVNDFIGYLDHSSPHSRLAHNSSGDVFLDKYICYTSILEQGQNCQENTQKRQVVDTVLKRFTYESTDLVWLQRCRRAATIQSKAQLGNFRKKG
ncbi:hypothetical protein UY3_02459 [Chelonia mydas]|uniref:Uncharacterized protein n=1 Tax=Chelonia mydas TaxID=8469 RepID=M7BQX7_CHEMY|nr:hypothetical protein UY3_02459 [Chelonia mydas]